MVNDHFYRILYAHLYAFQNICCLSGARAQELYNLSRFARVSAFASVATPFSVDANDL